LNSRDKKPEDEEHNTAALSAEGAAAAVTASAMVRVEILGFAESSGTPEFNQQLSQEGAAIGGLVGVRFPARKSWPRDEAHSPPARDEPKSVRL
jgi:hypothetical protein